jgi:D-alanyl-D-alanine carboxypeptidase
MSASRFESPEELPALDLAAAGPVVALLDRVPGPPGTPLPLLRADDLASRFEGPTLALLDRVLRIAGDPPAEPAHEWIELPVAGLEASAWLAPGVMEAWERCAGAMRADLGHSALVSSGYRSPAFQAMLVVWLAADRGGDLAAALRRAHPPSRSEHCLPVGHALDLTTNGAPVHDPAHFAGTPEYAWMRERGAEFGFVESYPANTADPVGPEPWHWRGPRD